jgi:hypothetical protein
VDAAIYEQLAMTERWVRRLMSAVTQLVEEEPACRRRLSWRRLGLEKWGGREDDWASGGTGCINKAGILVKFSEEGNILVKFFEEGNILARPDRLLFAVDAGSHIVYLKLLSGCNQYSRMV